MFGRQASSIRQDNQGPNVEFTNYVRKPFTVEAVEVTKENIGEVAELIGTLRAKDDGTPYIQVDRRLVPNVFRVYVGFWVTRMGDNLRCYSKRIFTDQFVLEEGNTMPDIRDDKVAFEVKS